jgi:hypothetical protein
MDSNHDKSLQRALCYRYTIGQWQRENSVFRVECQSKRKWLAEVRLHSRSNGHIFTSVKTFAQVLDSADELDVEEQESLVEVLQRRLAAHHREALCEAVKSARREFESGCCRPATPKQIVKRILA